jgi:hypothetical protein
MNRILAGKNFGLIEEDPDSQRKAEKERWVLAYGSDLLKRSIAAGYDANRRYVMERAEIESPGFRQLEAGKFVHKADSPPLACIKACALIEGSYCGEIGYINPEYCIAIDYLGETIVKKIKNPYEESKRDRLYQSTGEHKLFKLVVVIGAVSINMLLLASLVFSPAPKTLTESQ